MTPVLVEHELLILVLAAHRRPCILKVEEVINRTYHSAPVWRWPLLQLQAPLRLLDCSLEFPLLSSLVVLDHRPAEVGKQQSMGFAIT